MKWMATTVRNTVIRSVTHQKQNIAANFCKAIKKLQESQNVREHIFVFFDVHYFTHIIWYHNFVCKHPSEIPLQSHHADPVIEQLSSLGCSVTSWTNSCLAFYVPSLNVPTMYRTTDILRKNNAMSTTHIQCSAKYSHLDQRCCDL